MSEPVCSKAFKILGITWWQVHFGRGNVFEIKTPTGGLIASGKMRDGMDWDSVAHAVLDAYGVEGEHGEQDGEA